MFNIYLFSDASTKQFKNNTPSKFTVQLPKTYNLQNYECAVVEVTLPNRIVNIRNEHNGLTTITENNWFTGYSESGYFDTVEQLLFSLQVEIVRRMSYYERAHHPVKPYTKYKDGRVTLRVWPPFKEVRIFGDLAKMLGFNVNTNGYASVKKNKPLTGDRMVSSAFNATGRSVFLYSNITREQCVGSVSTPLLRIVNLSGAINGNYTHHIYDKPQYTPLRSDAFNSIELQLCDELGELIPFNDGVTRVTLSFRPINGI